LYFDTPGSYCVSSICLIFSTPLNNFSCDTSYSWFVLFHGMLLKLAMVWYLRSAAGITLKMKSKLFTK